MRTVPGAASHAREEAMFGKRNKIDSAEIDNLANTLGDVAFFEGFTHDELRRVAELAEEVEAAAGAQLIDQGRIGQECYVILEGQAGGYMGDEHVATVGPGTMVGEMSLVEHRPRNASVIAETPMKLVAFDTKAFKTLLEEMPKVHDRVMATLAARLKKNAGPS
ncbi:MAG: cyclic nucleotide-binding domain-containing protein [Acidimicrobiales bacterium]|nr:cyclic nucleotide-binding domain-containing protein [Acidimicrobiales bacterium]